MGKKNDIALAERQVLALKLRGSGATYEAVAAAMNISTATAWRLVKGGLDRAVREPAAELVALECLRLDRLLQAVWPQAIGITTGGRPNLHAVDRILAIMQRRARLLGLDAPAKTQISGEWVMKGAAAKVAESYGLDPREILAQAEELLKGLSDE